MHRKLFRFVEVTDMRVCEVALDERLSFTENLKLLERIIHRDLSSSEIYDPYKKIFLERNIPLKEFGFEGFTLLYLFNRLPCDEGYKGRIPHPQGNGHSCLSVQGRS